MRIIVQLAPRVMEHNATQRDNQLDGGAPRPHNDDDDNDFYFDDNDDNVQLASRVLEHDATQCDDHLDGGAPLTHHQLLRQLPHLRRLGHQIQARDKMIFKIIIKYIHFRPVPSKQYIVDMINIIIIAFRLRMKWPAGLKIARAVFI